MKIQHIEILWDATEVVPKEKFISLNTHIRKTEGSQTSDFSIHLKKLEEQIKPLNNISRRKKTVNMRVEINEIKMINVRNKKGNITTDSRDIKRIIIREYSKLYAIKFENSDQGLANFLQKTR